MARWPDSKGGQGLSVVIARSQPGFGSAFESEKAQRKQLVERRMSARGPTSDMAPQLQVVAFHSVH